MALKVITTEELVLRRLLFEAFSDGYEVCYIGVRGGRIGIDTLDLDLDEVVEKVLEIGHTDITFKKIGSLPDEDGKYLDAFWVRVIAGNGEDYISDYTAKPSADKIIDRINSLIEVGGI